MHRCMSAKQKIVHGRGPSNINLGIFVCSFDVRRASYDYDKGRCSVIRYNYFEKLRKLSSITGDPTIILSFCSGVNDNK